MRPQRITSLHGQPKLYIDELVLTMEMLADMVHHRGINKVEDIYDCVYDNLTNPSMNKEEFRQTVNEFFDVIDYANNKRTH